MTTPIAFPDLKISSCTFDHVVPRDVARMEGRRTEAEDAHFGYWTASYSLAPYANTDIGAVLAFLNYRGTFLAHNPLRPRPVAYGQVPLAGTKAVGGAFNGDAGINDLTDRLAPVITGLPDAFVIKAGDFVEFRASSTVRSLHLITADATANSSGVITLALSTPVPSVITDSHTAHFEKPSCVMMITERSVPSSVVNSTYSFSAVEVFPS